MSARATTIAEGFSQKVLREMYENSLTDVVVNRDYEGEINGVGSVLNILNFDRVAEKTYSGSDLTADSLTENNAVLTIDQYKSFYWKEKTLDNWLSYIKDPHPTIVEQVAKERNKNMDEYILGLYADAGAGNRVGTDYTTGTVEIDSSGNVTGSGTTFTSGMVGKGFKASGHTQWYRVKTFTNTTTIVIEDDLDDVSSTYSGGAISALSTYTIEAVSAVSITTTNLLEKVGDLREKLDSAENLGGLNIAPDADRFLIVPPEFMNTVTRASGVALHVDPVYNDLVQRGYIGSLLGFKLFQSTRLTGDNSSGYHMIGGHPGWLTFAEKQLEATIEEDLIGNFGSAYKDLFVYGAKVADSRRHFAGEIFATFA
jgi:hypothetical protein